ncbi:MAG: ZIP family metal transporter [Chloroflexi bacterium]|nr:ZIP family metal transporter [Chloroflexota bacterium]
MPIAAILPFFSTLLGGVAALRLRHRLHAFMALAAGVVVATAVADLLPEAFDLVGADAALPVGIAAVVGFIGFSLVEAFLHQSSFEHALEHEIAFELAGEHGAHREGYHGGPHATQPVETKPMSATSRVLGILPPLSLIIHSTLDGLAIGLAFQAGGDLGLIVLLAVLAHDFADGMNVVTLALDAARGERTAVVLLVLDAIAPLAGAALSTIVSISPATLGLLLAAFAGVFIAVGAGHLLPESQHRDPRRGPALVALSGLGAAVVLAIRAVSG